jgi:hypothetical protein
MPDELIAIPVEEYERLKRIEHVMMEYFAQYQQTLHNQMAQQAINLCAPQQVNSLNQHF